MELLVNIEDKKLISRLKDLRVDGIIVGCKALSNKYNFSLDDLIETRKECLINGIDLYFEVDILIKEEMNPLVEEFLEFAFAQKVKGIYFNDLSIYEIALRKGFREALIYNPGPLLTSSLDAIFFLKKDINSLVLARELTLDEILKIADNTNHQVDVQVGGHILMSRSERHFISDYLEYINSDIKYDEAKVYEIREETRDKKMPIIEGRFGTEIYSDFILLALDEYNKIKSHIKRAIIDTIFLDEELVIDLVNAHKGILSEEEIKMKYSDKYFDKGYMYTKTYIKKEEVL